MTWEEPEKKRWFTMRMLAWAMFELGLTLFSMVVISRYISLWVVEQMHGTVAAFNFSWAMSILAAALLQVVLSPISDELGKRRVFVVWFTLSCVVACALIYKAQTLNMGLALFALANLGYQTAFVFFNAMLGDVTDRRHESRVSGIGVGFGYLGSILGLLISARYVDVSASNPNYAPVFLVAATLVLLFALPLFLFVPEKPGLVQLNLSQSLTNSVGAFMTTLRRVARNREMSLFFLACLLMLDAVHTVIVNMTLYCKKVVGLDALRGVEWPFFWKDQAVFTLRANEIDLFLIVSASFGIIGALVIGHLADKTSRYHVLLTVIGIWMLALVLAMFSVQRKLFWVTGPLFGLGFGGIWTVSRAYLQQLCHPEERSQMFALFGLVGRCAAIIGPLVWAAVFAIFEPSLGERKAYRIAIGSVLGLMMIGFWILLLSRKTESPSPKEERAFTYR